ncbi:hypothetical protein [Sulfurimonas xiamenensis]|uniref:Uncharacterized protein n=1 Tax=Sulfurimonas xiamenensis TaxID=2590021 RepID=A0AAJ4A2B1_9BACT|nr:hypothetical protein [Sulfurimonas xiamenensis]PLY13704.1 MAG: hypothetical protein C0628_05675 [Sulfurimonas sp.]QFR42455.1 hypothetical protein FJR47_00390 [Sulfurimonas xiamenensis]
MSILPLFVKEQMKKRAKAVKYANNNISSSLDGFWLGGESIKISLSEQVNFISSLVKKTAGVEECF